MVAEMGAPTTLEPCSRVKVSVPLVMVPQLKTHIVTVAETESVLGPGLHV